MTHDIQVGDVVRLTGADWNKDLDFALGTEVKVTEVDPDGEVWAGVAGTVGNLEGLFSPDNPEPYGDFSVELVSRAESPGMVEAGEHVIHGTFSGKVNDVLSQVGHMLITKNESYGDAALNPIRTFSKADAVEQLKVRIDDKLSRIQRGTEYEDEDTELDLIGYLVLLRIAKERLQ